MNFLLKKLVKGEEITDKDIENELYEICDREHSGCSSNCPVYHLQMEKENKCDYFKDGKKMLGGLKNEI